MCEKEASNIYVSKEASNIYMSKESGEVGERDACVFGRFPDLLSSADLERKAKP